MRWGSWIVLTLALTAPGSAAPRKSPANRPSGSTKAAPAPKTQVLPKLMQSCDAHKFETVVDTLVEGQPHKSKVKLCGVEGQSDAAWIETLRDAINKLEANKDMAAAQRDQIVAAIKAEIARLNIVEEPAPAIAPALKSPPEPAENRGEVPAPTPVSRDYAILPPLPTQPQSAPASLPAPPAATDVAPAASTVLAAPAQPIVAPVAVPKLKFACYSPGDLNSDTPCGEFVRETVLTIRSGGAMPSGAALRFVRNGKVRADIDLTPLSRDRSMQMALPRDVCAGFGAGRLELQVVVNGSTARSEGIYPLRCY